MNSAVLRQMIQQLVAAGLLVEESADEFTFRHALTREAAYGSLVRDARRRYHLIVGDVLETLQAGTLDLYFSDLAYHYQRAEQPEKERPYARQAGERAARQFAYSEALQYFGRALELTPETEPGARFELLLAREKVHDIQGARASQAQDLADLEALANSLDDRRRAEAALRQASYADRLGDYPAAVAAAERAVALAQSAGADEAEALAHQAWGAALWRQAEFGPAHAQAARALELAQRAGLAETEAEAVRLQGAIYDSQSDHRAARACLERSLQLYRQLGDRRGQGRSLNSLGVLAYHQSEYSEARANLRQSLQLRREISDRYGEGITLLNLGILARSQADVLEAQAHFQHSVSLCRDIGDREGEASALGGLGSTALYYGDQAAARDYYDQCLEIAREIGDRINECSGLVGLSMVAHHLGDKEALLRYGLEELRIAQEVGARSYEGSAWRQVGEGWLASGQPAQAAEAFRRAVAVYEELDLPKAAIYPRAGLARAALAAGDLGQALALVEGILATAPVDVQEDADTPALVYLACYRVLQAADAGRARDFLRRAYAELEDRAGRIDDEAVRRSFWENVPWNCELRAAWEQESR